MPPPVNGQNKRTMLEKILDKQMRNEKLKPNLISSYLEALAHTYH